MSISLSSPFSDSRILERLVSQPPMQLCGGYIFISWNSPLCNGTQTRLMKNDNKEMEVHYCSSIFLILLFLSYIWHPIFHFFRHLKYFQEVLSYQSETFATQDMNIEAHIVQKSDLKRHLTDKEIGEILSAQSQKRDRDSTWFHGKNNGNGNRDSRSDSSSSNGSVTYAG